MEGVGKREGGMGKCVGMSGNMGDMWKSVWGECGEVGESVGGAYTFLYTSPHSPDTSSHTHPTLFPYTPHSHLTRLSTLSHTHLTRHLPLTPPTLPPNPHASSNTSPYFIYPIPKFLTFFSYCQVSLTIK